MGSKEEARRYMQNRELSWLKFNERVLEEANCPNTPLMNRYEFLSIFTSNLDEFFMVRVGSLTDCMNFAPEYTDNKTGMNAKEELEAIHKAVRPLYKKRDESYRALTKELAEYGIVHLHFNDLSKQEIKRMDQYFFHSVLPLLSPQIIDPRHPFPHIGNKQINIAVTLKRGDKQLFGIIPLPSSIGRLFYPDADGARFLLAEDILLHYAETVFDMYTVLDKAIICVTRNADIDTDAGDIDEDIDYRQHMKQILKERLRLAPVRLEMKGELQGETMRFLSEKLHLKSHQIFTSKAPLDLSYCFSLEKRLSGKDRDVLLRAPHQPQPSPFINAKESVLQQACRRDILLSYPYESMQPFLNLIKDASVHPEVLSIKITLYRISSHSKLAQYLIEAVENGKDVTVLMELRARFDEQNNIEWAQRLEEAGCHIIYGTDNFKVHSKICLLTVRHHDEIRHITQIGTGNYNEKTAKLYTDLSFITADPEIGKDAQEFFLNMSMGNLKGKYNQLWVAPSDFKERILHLIDVEIEKAQSGRPSGIIMKCNSFTDRDIIQRLAKASKAGVSIQLLVRGICCLLPGVPGETENISVISIVGRFLEHSRIYCFGAREEIEVYISSGDMMTRNTEKRVEIACPILNGQLKKRILSMLDIMFVDNVKAREMHPDGSYTCRKPGNEHPVNAQEIFVEQALHPGVPEVERDGTSFRERFHRYLELRRKSKK